MNLQWTWKSWQRWLNLALLVANGANVAILAWLFAVTGKMILLFPAVLGLVMFALLFAYDMMFVVRKNEGRDQDAHS
jgi:hypothetical protein